jgi:hypothetical protein
LEKYGALGNRDPSLWTRIKWSTEQSTVEHICQRISIHIKGIDMMLNPIMLYVPWRVASVILFLEFH